MHKYYAYIICFLFLIGIKYAYWTDMEVYMSKQSLIEMALFCGFLMPLVFSVFGGPNSYFWQFFAWAIGAK